MDEKEKIEEATVEETKTDESVTEEAKVEETKTEETKTEDKKEVTKTDSGKKINPKIFIIVGAVLIAILLIAIIVDIVSADKKDDDNDNNTTTEASIETTADTEADTGKEDVADTTTEDKKEDTNKDNTVKATITNSWEGSGAFFGQLDLSITNSSSSEIKDWKIEIDAPSDLKIDSGWNCKYEIKDGKLVVTGVEYNSTVAANSTVKDIGIILSSADKANIDGLTKAPRLYVGGELYSVAEQNDSTTESSDGGDAVESTTTEESSNAATTEAASSGSTTEAPTTTEAVSNDKPAAESGTPFANHGKLSVSGVNLVDASGNKYQLKGVSTHGIAWFPDYVNYEAFKTLRDDWGANLIRIAMYSGENSGYCTGGDKEYLKGLIDKGVKAATDLGMYVIIDWHVLGDLNPLTHKEEAKKFFEEMSAKYKDYDNVIYEICNEPNGGTPWSDVKAYAEEVIPIIKKNNPDAIIIVGTPNWSQDVDVAAKDPIKGYTNVMYAAHFYAATHKDWLRDKIDTALAAGLPIIISEFSICDASGNGGIDYNEAARWMEYLNNKNISYAGWSLSNKNETSALISSSCGKVGGWTEADLSEAGKWLRNTIKGN